MNYLDLNKYVSQIYQNAVEHGWHEKKREFGEVCSLIEDELCEALEEYRCGRPNVWYPCKEGVLNKYCDPKEEHEGYNCVPADEPCKYRDNKPEGIMFELVDAVIRILDWMGEEGGKLMPVTGSTVGNKKYAEGSLPIFVCYMNYLVSTGWMMYESGHKEYCAVYLSTAVMYICQRIEKEGYDPEKLIIEKHTFNKSRPYRHGGKRC